MPHGEFVKKNFESRASNSFDFGKYSLVRIPCWLFLYFALLIVHALYSNFGLNDVFVLSIV